MGVTRQMAVLKTDFQVLITPSCGTTADERVLNWRACISVALPIVTTRPHDDDSNSCSNRGNAFGNLDE